MRAVRDAAASYPLAVALDLDFKFSFKALISVSTVLNVFKLLGIDSWCVREGSEGVLSVVLAQSCCILNEYRELNVRLKIARILSWLLIVCEPINFRALPPRNEAMRLKNLWVQEGPINPNKLILTKL